MSRNYILDGKTPVAIADVIEWAQWFDANDDKRIIGQETLEIDGEQIKVSTIFLGLDHGYGGLSILFETMIFGGKHDMFQRRYSTWEEAEVAHKEIVEAVKNGTLSNDD